MAKFNVLHLHPVDAESFPIKFNKKPQSDLIKGSYHSAFYYSTEDLKDLIRYGFARGIIVYVEYDLPGHTYSWRFADPEIVANCPSKTNINNWAVNPANEKTYQYIRGVLEETFQIYKELEFHITPMIHLGGDEVVGACWKEDPQIN